LGKWIFRLMLVVGFAILLLIFTGFFQLVRADDGYHLIRKERFHVAFPVIDVRDWKVTDWLENSEIRNALAEIRLTQLREEAGALWEEISGALDRLAEDARAELDSGDAREKLDRLYEEARTRGRELQERFENGKIDREALETRIREVEEWFQRQIDAIR